MFSNIFLNKDNIIANCRALKSACGGKLCVMVKANAYGHGDVQVVEMLEGEIDYYGVSCQQEAERLRQNTKAHIVVFGKCNDYKKCIEEEISFALLSFKHAKEMVALSKKTSIAPRMHLCINSGMNRYGIKNRKELKRVIDLLNRNNLQLEGIYTHFSSLTTDSEYTERQKKIFKDYTRLLPKTWKTLRHVGGGGTIFGDFDADMYRVGLEVYGYGKDFVKPVLSIESEIVDIQRVEKGEHVGYLCGFTASKDMTVATIPLGYGDGFPRKLSNNISVQINGKIAKSTGNICMDAFMVDVSDIKCKKGDKVKVFANATEFAKKLGTTEYEVLTNFAKFRGDRQIR